jgi:hypothetical protein
MNFRNRPKSEEFFLLCSNSKRPRTKEVTASPCCFDLAGHEGLAWI